MASSSNSGTGGNRGGNTEKRGFASMDPERQREIARMGGEASHGGGRKKETGRKASEQGGGGAGGNKSGGSKGGGRG